MRATVLLAALALSAAPAGAAKAWTLTTVNRAQWTRPVRQTGTRSPVVLRAQILLDRAYYSPGVLDGRFDPNMRKALRLYQSRHGVRPTGVLDRDTWKRLVG